MDPESISPETPGLVRAHLQLRMRLSFCFKPRRVLHDYLYYSISGEKTIAIAQIKIPESRQAELGEVPYTASVANAKLGRVKSFISESSMQPEG